jgi:ABC-type multidrug transport system ATPase subunit
LDEPTANLDVKSRTELLDLLVAIKGEGKTLLFSSHRLDEVMDLADRVLVLRQGRLIADCPPDRLLNEISVQARLSLLVPKDRFDHAVGVLKDDGYVVNPNGKRIWVNVVANQKGEPINSLAKAGIPVQDFQVEYLEEA